MRGRSCAVVVLVAAALLVAVAARTCGGSRVIPFAVSGKGSGGAGSALLGYEQTADVGTARFSLTDNDANGEVATQAYMRWGPYAWSGGAYDIVSSVGVSRSGDLFANLYTYCWTNTSTPGGSTLLSVYFEAFGIAPVAAFPAPGVCSLTDTHVTLTASLPALVTWPHVAVNVSVHGPDMVFGPSRGWAAGKGMNLTIGVFSVVNCLQCTTLMAKHEHPHVPSQVAGDGSSGGWIELHSIVDSAATGPCFAILYFFPSDTSRVLMEYGLCPHTLASLPSLALQAHWSGSIIHG